MDKCLNDHIPFNLNGKLSLQSYAIQFKIKWKSIFCNEGSVTRVHSREKHQKTVKKKHQKNILKKHQKLYDRTYSCPSERLVSLGLMGEQLLSN